MQIFILFEVNNWKKEKKLPSLGMPPFLGSGSHECNGEKYRFVVMERYGTDLWKIFLENGRKFPEPTVYKLGWQIVLKFIYILYIRLIEILYSYLTFCFLLTDQRIRIHSQQDLYSCRY